MPQNLALIIQLCIFSYPELFFLDTRLSVKSNRPRFITKAVLDFFVLPSCSNTFNYRDFLQLMDTRVYYPKSEEKDLGKLYLE